MNVSLLTPEPRLSPRILYVITKANLGGAQRYVLDLATAAQARGYEVTVASGAPGELHERLIAAGVAVVSLPSLERDIRLGSDIRALWALWALMRTLRPTVVHSNSSKAGALAALAARLTGVKHVVFTSHAWAFNEARPLLQKFVIALIHYSTVLLSDTTICVSHALRNQARYMWGVQRRLVVVHNGVAPAQLYTRQEAREKLAPGHAGTTWIGSLAELHPVKQLDVLLRAFSAIADRYPETLLVLMGDGEERARLEQLARVLRLGDRVLFCGHVYDGPRYLPALDIFVLPSRSEALGLSLLEAGLASLPAIASRVGGIPEIVTDKTSGLLVPPGDMAALAAALTFLLGHPDSAAAYGQQLHEKVTAEFSKEKMLQTTFQLYANRTVP